MMMNCKTSRGLLWRYQQSIFEAFPYYQRCIELNDSNASGLFNVGRYFYNKAMETRQNSRLYGKKLANLVNPIYREALPYLEKSYAINPSNQDVRNALRDIYYKLGEADKLQAIERSPLTDINSITEKDTLLKQTVLFLFLTSSLE